jgi:formylglycine-generating enzyme required for sulfatase activity
VLRGGSFRYVTWGLRSAVRNWVEPENRDWDVPEDRLDDSGFRVVRGARPSI